MSRMGKVGVPLTRRDMIEFGTIASRQNIRPRQNG
jgi:hypothetical protein